MSPWKRYTRIIIPSMLRRALPFYGNEVILMLHATTIAFTATVPDILKLHGMSMLPLMPRLMPLALPLCCMPVWHLSSFGSFVNWNNAGWRFKTIESLGETMENSAKLVIRDLCKSFGDHEVLKGFHRGTRR